ncbi:DUF3987 domain-containing protein [Moheibacter sediminis]|uniref:DUF3987 domain-containing protein n=1 Tax=Moheibacter sediminis TaxID=1434700 RepID=A0A1W2C7U6_9FLAO|nr:DUF3987 domain-containing protein [Moheibacter sediminis]SMC81279.1 Protein of unknown function [Moheibacter sediminis]
MIKEIEESKKARFGSSPDLAMTASHKNLIPEEVYEDLPELLKEICLEFQGRERDIILLSCVGVISGCMSNVYGIYDSRNYSPNLYVFIIAPPASGKGVMEWSKILVEPIHEKIKEESKRKIAEYRNSENNEGVNEPKFQIKVVPGNTSASKLYTHLENAEDDLIIFESEADSLSNMLKQDWGNFSDLLRKAFHHETVSISRSTEDRFFEIKKPKISMILSGTPNQVRPLIESKENGLFSRFIYYSFEEAGGWKDVSPTASRISYDKLMDEKSKEIKELYEKLKKQNSVEVRMTKKQWDYFQERMSLANSIIQETGKDDFIPVVKRLGLIAFRLICLFTVLEKQEELVEGDVIFYAEDKTVKAAMRIIKILLDHSLSVFDQFEKNAVSMTMQERDLLSKLPDEFKRSRGLEIAQKVGIPERTFDEILKKWNDKILEKISHGTYKKVKRK